MGNNELKFYGTGRRKNSIARVYIVNGKGNIIINNKEIKEYISKKILITIIKKPLLLTDTIDKYNIIAKVHGGGISGQAGAIRHGISRALIKIKNEYRSILKKEGFLTRDSRMKERRKYGLKKARKASQFSKR